MALNRKQKSYMATASDTPYEVSTKQEQLAIGLEEKMKCHKNQRHSEIVDGAVEDEENHNQDESRLPSLDGKHAWMTLAGVILISLPLGLSLVWGVMQDYYQREQTFPGSNTSVQLTFVGTLFQAICFSFMFFTNMLYSFLGVRRLVLLGTILISGGLVLSAQATSIWHLYLSLSVCTGTGVASMQVTSLRLLPNWFQKYRNTAFGIQTAVIPCGGLVYPYVMVYINSALGPSWTYRIFGLFYFVASISGLCIIRERTPPTNSTEERKKIFNFHVVKNANFIIWIIVHPLQLYAQYISYAFLPLNATYLGLSDVNGATIVSIMAGSNLVGRVAIGIIADRIGGLNMFSICMGVSTIAIWVIWVLARSFSGLIGFALTYGLVNGCFGAVVAGITITIVGLKNYPAATGIRMITFIASVFGPLVAGYLESINHAQPFLYCKLVGGAGAAISCVLALVLKFRLDKRPLAKL